jgi:alanine dehydrogenase
MGGPLVVGGPGETKPGEHRVAVTPDGVRQLARRGVPVLVEAGAALDPGIGDGEYRAAGAEVLDRAVDVWARAHLVCKVKEPQVDELDHLRPGLVLCAYLHVAAYPAVAEALLGRGVAAVAYETVQASTGARPLLTPMSEAAGRMAPRVGPGSSSASPGDGPAARRGPPRRGGPRTRQGGLLLRRGGCPGTPSSRAADTPGCRSRRRLGRHVSRTHTYGAGGPAQP